jgi:hypothetical protein
MSSWRDLILNDFVPHVCKLTLVADPDCLLTEEKLAQELRDRKFELIEFHDPIAFRYAYESKYRSIWDQGQHTDLVVVLRLQDTELESLPYDLLQAGRKLSFNLGELFPNLSYSVLEELDQSLLDELFEAQKKYSPDRMGDNATKDFILRHVFFIAPELISNEVELLRVFLRLHYGNLFLPLILKERLIEVLESYDRFTEWPTPEIVGDDKVFFAFLQERWPIFLARMDKTLQATKDCQNENLKFSGPAHLPFDHQDIKVYIDNLFLEGKLSPIQLDALCIEKGSWIQNGVILDKKENDERRIDGLFDHIENDVPTLESRYTDWIQFALRWAELSSLVYCGNNDRNQTRLKERSDIVNNTFSKWLVDHYSNLINQPPTNPAMVHHIPRRLAREIEESNNRIALIVMDGLALDQWVTIRRILQKQQANILLRESATFAWIPTLTSISRQSIFSGKPPLYFPSSIHSTHREEKLWKQFWEGYGLSRSEIFYLRGLGNGDATRILDSKIHSDKTKVVGLVVDQVDRIMHGMQLGAAGMHNQIQQWCHTGFLPTLVKQLTDIGYAVWLTSDHGNIECNGRGCPTEGVIAETRGERVRVYPTPDLRSHVAQSFSFSQEWDPIGLPEDYFPLVTKGHDAFVNPGETVVCHGGISIEEIIVPFVKVEWSTL